MVTKKALIGPSPLTVRVINEYMYRLQKNEEKWKKKRQSQRQDIMPGNDIPEKF